MGEQGVYRELAPPPDLSPFIACTWTRIAPPDGTREPVIPDGCVDIILVGDGVPHIAGPADETVWVALAGGVAVHGIRFRPGLARDVLRCDLHELRNAHVDLVDVIGRYDGPHGVDALLAWVRTRVSRLSAGADLARVLLQTSSIDDAISELGVSARGLHRDVTRRCGYGPKLLQRILRMQHAIRIAHGQTLAETAARAGYADQAHMTRDFVALTGMTPAEYRAHADPRVGTWFVSDLFKTLPAR